MGWSLNKESQDKTFFKLIKSTQSTKRFDEGEGGGARGGARFIALVIEVKTPHTLKLNIYH